MLDSLFLFLIIILPQWQEFPPTSKLDHKVYGEQTSTITKEQLEINLDGLTIDEASILGSIRLCFTISMESIIAYCGIQVFDVLNKSIEFYFVQ